jgi:hypothetical protein
MKFIIELAPDMWIAPWTGDPGRTLVRSSALTFDSQAKANRRMNKEKSQWTNRDSSGWRVVPLVPASYMPESTAETT